MLGHCAPFIPKVAIFLVSQFQASEESCVGIPLGPCGAHSGHEAGESFRQSVLAEEGFIQRKKFIQWQHSVPKSDPAPSIDYKKRPRRELASPKGSFCKPHSLVPSGYHGL